MVRQVLQAPVDAGDDPEGMTAAAIIRALDLKPHPEGGHYRETFRHVPQSGGRGAMTAIYYLLQQGRGLGLASRRCRRDLALLRRRDAGAGLVA